MADIPDSVDQQTAKIALAWEMVKVAITSHNATSRYKPEFENTGIDERMKQLTELFRKAYQEINNTSPSSHPVSADQ